MIFFWTKSCTLSHAYWWLCKDLNSCMYSIYQCIGYQYIESVSKKKKPTLLSSTKKVHSHNRAVRFKNPVLVRCLVCSGKWTIYWYRFIKKQKLMWLQCGKWTYPGNKGTYFRNTFHALTMCYYHFSTSIFNSLGLHILLAIRCIWIWLCFSFQKFDSLFELTSLCL